MFNKVIGLKTAYWGGKLARKDKTAVIVTHE
jgi:hypothetical protein